MVWKRALLYGEEKIGKKVWKKRAEREKKVLL